MDANYTMKYYDAMKYSDVLTLCSRRNDAFSVFQFFVYKITFVNGVRRTWHNVLNFEKETIEHTMKLCSVLRTKAHSRRLTSTITQLIPRKLGLAGSSMWPSYSLNIALHYSMPLSQEHWNHLSMKVKAHDISQVHSPQYSSLRYQHTWKFVPRQSPHHSHLGMQDTLLPLS